MTLTTRWRVLLVDDVADIRLSVRLILEAYGPFEIVGEAADGRAGVELAGELQPDVVLLDLSMPKMDGLEALPEILQAAPGADVIIFSGFVEERLGPQVRQLGGLGYIEKGVEPDELVDGLLGLVGDPPSGGDIRAGAQDIQREP